MLKKSLLTCAVTAAYPAVALADPIPPVPDANPDTRPDSIPSSTRPVDAPPPLVTPVDTPPLPPPADVAPATTAVPAMDHEGLSATSYAWHDERMSSGIGVAAIIGGGVSGFTDRQMRDTVSSNVSGLWDARFTFGSHVPIGLDVAYLGTAVNLNSLSGTQTATLVGTTAEGALRWNILPHADFNPYIFGGMGWQRYDVTGRTVNLSDSGMRQSDNSIVFPMGAGLSYRHPSGFLVDARGTFRANVDQGLVLQPGNSPSSTNSSNYAPMHTWEASAAVGYEF
jgi:hypothetical protein